MTFDEYWQSLMERNQSMKDSSRMTISVESFKRALRQAFEKGCEQQRRSENILDRILNRNR